MEKKSMREQMPLVTAFVDKLRDAFGADGINQSIRAGMQGKPNYFHATENGHVLGTAFVRGKKS